MSINEAERKQDEFTIVLNDLKTQPPIKEKYIEAKNKDLDNGKNFYDGRQMIFKGSKKEYFQFTMMMKIADLKTKKKILEIEMVSLIVKRLIDLLILKEET